MQDPLKIWILKAQSDHIIQWQVPLEGWVQIVLFLGHYEGYFWRQDPKRAPGDYEGATGSDVVLEQGNDMM